MAKAFHIPPWRRRQINAKFRRKGRVIHQTVSAMEAVMKKAVAAIIEHYVATGNYAAPSLSGMFQVSENFYREVSINGFDSARDEKEEAKGKKRLAKKRTNKIAFLENVFRDKREWPRAMKRSKKLTERLRDQYLEKLGKRFEEILPALKAGEITPDDAKSHMMKAWKASKSRVETIFRTETTNYFGKAQVSFFEGDPEIIGFLFDSVYDTSRTEICKSRHGLVYRPGTALLHQNTPALHFNCRSHLIALANTPHNRKLLEDPDRDPANRKVVPLPPGWRK